MMAAEQEIEADIGFEDAPDKNCDGVAMNDETILVVELDAAKD